MVANTHLRRRRFALCCTYQLRGKEPTCSMQTGIEIADKPAWTRASSQAVFYSPRLRGGNYEHYRIRPQNARNRRAARLCRGENRQLDEGHGYRPPQRRSRPEQRKEPGEPLPRHLRSHTAHEGPHHPRGRARRRYVRGHRRRRGEGAAPAAQVQDARHRSQDPQRRENR